MPDEQMLSIGGCFSCKSGPLGLRRCGRCARVVLLCDECDAAYGEYSAEAEATFAEEDRMPCPHCNASLWDKHARWATENDLAREPALLRLIENDQVVLERGKPFSPGAFGE